MPSQSIDSKPERILSLFPNSMQTGLVEFAKYISTIHTDYIIYMARKSVRLLDLLTLAGLPQPNRPIFYHHILSQDLSWLNGKTVTLVDDTLILGTTIRAAIKKLQQVGVKDVSTIVFAVDRDNWQKELVEPTCAFMHLSAEDILAFCSWEVQSFAIWGIPYLSDFPISKEFHLSREKFEQILEVGHWETHRVSDFDEQSGISAYSAIPIDGTNNVYLEKLLGNDIHALCSITKVRIYRNIISDKNVRIKFLPMITLHSLSEESIDELFDIVIGKFECILEKNLVSIRDNIIDSEARLRIVQYIMSALLGFLYCVNVKLSETTNKIIYSGTDIYCLFGNPVGVEIEECLDKFFDVYKSVKILGETSKKIESSELPQAALSAKDECKAVIDTIYRDINKTILTQSRGQEGEFNYVHDENNNSVPINIMWLMEKIFIYFFNTYELEARKEVKEECARARKEKREVIFSEEKTPKLNRLRYGFDWDSIATQLLIDRGVSDSPLRKLRLSIFLDKMVDMGIAVPILCRSKGVIFRAYRHGEGVKFAEYERLLAYNAIDTLLQYSSTPVIKKTILEKFLVCFLRVGVEINYLDKRDPSRCLPGQTAQVGFYLHGAVSHMPEEVKPIATSQKIWLTSTLECEGLLVWDDVNEGFFTGKEPAGQAVSKDVQAAVEELGMVFGLASNSQIFGKQALTTDEMILLASCCTMKDTTMALAAELHIIRTDLLKIVEYLQDDSIVRPDAVRRMGRIIDALKSARLKYFERHSYGKIVMKLQKILTEYSPLLKITAKRVAGYLHDIGNADKKTDALFTDLTDRCWIHIISLAELAYRISIVMKSIISKENHYDNALAFLLADRVFRNNFNNYAAINKEDMIKQIARDILTKSFLKFSKYPEDMQKLLKRINKSDYNIGKVNAIDINAIKQQCQRTCMSATEDYRYALEEYNKHGSKLPYKKYGYIVFYDIINSTCQNLEMPQSDIDSMKLRVALFIAEINESLKGLIQDCKQIYCAEACCVNGDIYSTDDAKHFLVDGDNPAVFDALKLAMIKVLNMTQKHKIRVRIIISTTHFAGDCASVVNGSFGSNGRSFWSEFNKTIKKTLKELEAGANNGDSYVFLCDEMIYKDNFFFLSKDWKRCEFVERIPLGGFFNILDSIEYTYATVETASFQ